MVCRCSLFSVGGRPNRLPAALAFARPGCVKDFTSITFDREKTDGGILDYNEKGLFDDRIDVWSINKDAEDSSNLWDISSGGIYISVSETPEENCSSQSVLLIVTPAGGANTSGLEDLTALFYDYKTDWLLLDSLQVKIDMRLLLAR